jgi:hypothetical protein
MTSDGSNQEEIMSNTPEAIANQGDMKNSELGSKFIRLGLGQFVLGFVVGFVPIVHYMHGAVAGDVGPVFLKNMTLWWGCPAVLVEQVLKTGGLGMAAIGLCYVVYSRNGTVTPLSRGELLAPKLCVGGLIATLVYASVGYVVCNLIWPNFYFEPVEMGKNVWLAGQGITIAIYVTGLSFAFGGVRRLTSQ